MNTMKKAHTSSTTKFSNYLHLASAKKEKIIWEKSTSKANEVTTCSSSILNLNKIQTVQKIPTSEYNPSIKSECLRRPSARISELNLKNLK